MFKLEFTTDNAAFDNNAMPGEVARILQWVAGRIKDGHVSGRVIDANGNIVGGYLLDDA